MKPQTVIFDESTSMLDPQARDGFKVIVDNLCDQGISVITITQSMDEAFESDRVVVLSGNHILADATPADLLRQHVLLKACGLKLPIIASLSLRLQEEGIAVPLTNKAEELENALWRLSATI